MALQGSIKVIANFTNTLAQSVSTNSSLAQLAATLAYVDGSGAAQANKIWAPITQYSVAQSTNTDIDLAGSLVGTYGTVVFAALKGLVIKAGDANLGNLTIGNVSNGITAFLGAATHSIILQPGGVFAIASPGASGYSLTAGTADLLRVASAGTTGTYTWDILAWGI
jgi:hypothetical protein